jgi:hypothetical protein
MPCGAKNQSTAHKGRKISAMNIEKMSDAGAAEAINQICDGLKKHVESNPDSAKELLLMLTQECLDSLSEDDFFGTEGWEHAFGIEA